MATRVRLTLILTVILATIFCMALWQVFVVPYVQEELQNNKDIKYMHVPKAREKTEISYSYKSLPGWDFTRLINLDNFTFLLTNTICEENAPFDLLILVSSGPKNIDRRNTIRETWGQARQGMKILFMLGFVPNQEQQDAFDDEDRKYHDLVQGNFIDDYKNLSYKFTMGFKYTVYFCPSAKYILKTDDDLFVNMPFLMEYIKLLHPPEGKKNFLQCSIMDGSPAIREPSKWHVPFNEYPHKAYPIYCSGFAVLFSYDVVFRLYREAQRGEFFWVDDVHMTGKSLQKKKKNTPKNTNTVSGTLVKRINLRHTDLPKGKVLMSWAEMEVFLSSNGSKGPELFLYGPVNINAEYVRKMWVALKSRNEHLESARSSVTR